MEELKLGEFWQECLTKLTEILDENIVHKWIKPLKPLGFSEDDTVIKLEAPTELKKNWVQSYYANTIRDVILEILNINVRVEVVLAPKPQTSSETIPSADFNRNDPVVSAEKPIIDRSIATPTKESYRDKTFEDNTFVMEFEPEKGESEAVESIEALPEPMGRYAYRGMAEIPRDMQQFYKATNLNQRLTFQNLVVGDSNELAYVTAQNVVRNIGKHGYNPLFIYGKTGLGKTHIMHAIGNELFTKHKMRNVLYIHAETYYTEITRRMIEGRWVEYRAQDNKYINSDLLLMDDVQLFARKERTQQEFFVLYEALVNNDKQVVISCDTFPDNLDAIEDRLKSRFQNGLIIEIEPPDVELRVSILKSKAKDFPDMEFTDEVALYIASNIKSNVRELEGALQKVMAYSQFKQIDKPTVDTCKAALRDVLRQRNGSLTVENIQKTVADYYKIRISDIYSKSRSANLVKARHVAMYLTKELTRNSLPEIGQSFGGRDHSTIHHAVEKIASRRREDRQLNHDIRVLEQILGS
ncbi:chromosomal replication initiator protein DnaA [Taylorella equigenitalis]|uniref:chromosomal replication initiator protein DnaA n=1 Tax=Taylorella equigenitalis TaxID=29575 RepID=UPI00051D1975|nr:chromosomal replication initiator protein DnaA [Taylorella equigenitalis]ASY37108.1 chromosomal replication initiator protein DnaA [Taylorella equigenitalis]KGK33593.1 chromosomal replication initiator protein DnaA [Taylorella equigenitalis]WDU46398.1 chromosomal replication initiator protein DnaA [Taylorella equigenitalis]WDU47881.1 chromosomal replication initiator protein DnaA [Taylorella equigenitalis]WDU54842.1 chromosomal replication initiator protein DnaA [Taylorella equigenitalis]